MEETPAPEIPFESFTVRIWLERVGAGKTEWRGRIQHALSGETHYFREWNSLIDQVQSMLQLSRLSRN